MIVEKLILAILGTSRSSKLLGVIHERLLATFGIVSDEKEAVVARLVDDHPFDGCIAQALWVLSQLVGPILRALCHFFLDYELVPSGEKPKLMVLEGNLVEQCFRERFLETDLLHAECLVQTDKVLISIESVLVFRCDLGHLTGPYLSQSLFCTECSL